jgi:hypothetical protein
LDESKHTIEKNTEALVVTSKEIGLQINTEKSMCIFMFHEQNAGQNHNINICSKFFESGEQFKYFGRTLTKKKLHLLGNQQQMELWEYLLSFCAESSVSQVALQKYND